MSNIVRVNRMIKMDLYDSEVKLILRMRQVRKSNDECTFLVRTSPLSLLVLGQFEKLETIATSGSYVGVV